MHFCNRSCKTGPVAPWYLASKAPPPALHPGLRVSLYARSQTAVALGALSWWGVMIPEDAILCTFLEISKWTITNPEVKILKSNIQDLILLACNWWYKSCSNQAPHRKEVKHFSSVMYFWGDLTGLSILSSFRVSGTIKQLQFRVLPSYSRFSNFKVFCGNWQRIL